MYNYSQIKKIHLEITQKCQASCPMCDRSENGGSLNKHINLSELSLDDCKKIFKPSFIKQLDTMYMCGNLGDPIVALDTLEVFEYFRKHNSNMWLSMNTNAGARDSLWWTELAKIFKNKGAVIFSVDGLSDTNHVYRQNVNWNKVENSMRSFISAGGRARWDFLIFEHNQHQLDEARKFAETLGFEKFTPKKTGRFVTATMAKKEEHNAINHKGISTVTLKKPLEIYQNSALKKYDSIVEKYNSIDTYYDKTQINCKVKNEGNLFITAEGLAMPCCWTAGRMYKWWHKDPHVEQIWQFINSVGGKEALNAKNGLKKIFNTKIFDLIEESWSRDSCNNGKLKVCAIKCGTELDLFKEQYT